MHPNNVFHGPLILEKASKAMILLHGRGGTAQDILSLAHEFCDETIYLAAPQATNHMWYPQSFMVEESKNEPWLSSAINCVKKLIDDLSKSIPIDQIYVLGFSQGACLALETTARFPAKYGGVIAFTGGLIGKTIDKAKYHGNFKNTPIFIGTSDQDPYIPLKRAQDSKTLLENLGANVTLKVYPGIEHTINSDEINWVKKFLLPVK